MSNKDCHCGKYLVHYLRDCNRVPFGCIVATSPENIGVSVCCPKDRFNKKMARQIALGRALVTNDPLAVNIPKYRKILGFYGIKDGRTWNADAISIYDYTKEAVKYVKRRAKKFFKEENQEKAS
jgi:hypothetical protein